MFAHLPWLQKYRHGFIAVALGLSASLSAQSFPALGGSATPPSSTSPTSNNLSPLSSNPAPAGTPVYVPTKPAGTDSTADIHDIHNLVPLTFWEQHGLQIILGGVAGILVIAGVLSIVLRKKPQRVFTAYERALQELAIAKNLHAAGQDKNFAIAASDAVRRYLENAYRMPAPERTTEEFLQEAARHAWLQGELTELLKQFLQFCDLAKFAGQQFGEEERGKLLDSARAFLDTAEKLRQPPAPAKDQTKAIVTPPAKPTLTTS
jgi:hypothetical protein